MAPFADPYAVRAGSASSSSPAAAKHEDSGKGQGKGGKNGGKGNRGPDPTLQQLGHLAPQAKALQSSAAAMGWALSFTPKGSGRGVGSRGKANDNYSSNKTIKRSSATKVFSSGPSGMISQAVVKEGGRPAVMLVGRKEVPIS